MTSKRRRKKRQQSPTPPDRFTWSPGDIKIETVAPEPRE